MEENDPGLPSNEVLQARVSPNTDEASFSLILIARLDKLHKQKMMHESELKEVHCYETDCCLSMNKCMHICNRTELTIGPGFVVLRILMQQHSKSREFQAGKREM